MNKRSCPSSGTAFTEFNKEMLNNWHDAASLLETHTEAKSFHHGVQAGGDEQLSCDVDTKSLFDLANKINKITICSESLLINITVKTQYFWTALNQLIQFQNTIPVGFFFLSFPNSERDVVVIFVYLGTSACAYLCVCVCRDMCV